MAKATIQLSATLVSPIIITAYTSSRSMGTLNGETRKRTSTPKTATKAQALVRVGVEGGGLVMS